MTNALSALGLPLILLGLFVVMQFVPVCRYAFDDRGFSIRCLGVLVARFPYSEIIRVREAQWSDLIALPARYDWRPLSRRIFVELRTGVFRRVVITPPHQADFAEHLAKAGVKVSLPKAG